jgi:hypothetical protein
MKSAVLTLISKTESARGAYSISESSYTHTQNTRGCTKHAPHSMLGEWGVQHLDRAVTQPLHRFVHTHIDMHTLTYKAPTSEMNSASGAYGALTGQSLTPCTACLPRRRTKNAQEGHRRSRLECPLLRRGWLAPDCRAGWTEKVRGIVAGAINSVRWCALT